MKTEKNIKINSLIILFSILPISIIVGPSFSLINTVLLGLCFVLIYFSKSNIEINDFKPIFFLVILYFYLIFNSLISVDITSGIYRNFGFVRFILFFLIVNFIFFIPFDCILNTSFIISKFNLSKYLFNFRVITICF